MITGIKGVNFRLRGNSAHPRGDNSVSKFRKGPRRKAVNVSGQKENPKLTHTHTYTCRYMCVYVYVCIYTYMYMCVCITNLKG